jgi:hypothetical protein
MDNEHLKTGFFLKNGESYSLNWEKMIVKCAIDGFGNIKETDYICGTCARLCNYKC